MMFKFSKKRIFKNDFNYGSRPAECCDRDFMDKLANLPPTLTEELVDLFNKHDYKVKFITERIHPENIFTIEVEKQIVDD